MSSHLGTAWRCGLVAVALMMALGGCGRAGGQESASPASTNPLDRPKADLSVSAAVHDQLVPSTATDIPPAVRPVPTATEPLDEHAVVMPWRFVRLDNEGQTVIIWGLGEASCTEAAGVVVRETTESVLIAPIAIDYSGNPACAATMTYPAYGAVLLHEPLGNRSLLHAAVSPEFLPLLDRQLPTVTVTPNKPTS